jgi:elongation factor G
MKNIRNIGIMAHIDAGKTTVTERILYITGRIYKMGEVHDGQAVMDYLEQEQERGITITCAATTFPWKGSIINLIDTPGHVDFTIEVERSLRVLDGAVAVFDAVNGVEPQSETVWYQADTYHVARIAFINKMDRIGADFAMCLKMMQERFRQKIIPVQIPIGQSSEFSGIVDLVSMKSFSWSGTDPKDMQELPEIPSSMKSMALQKRDQLIEILADFDDALAEKYLDGQDIKEGEIHQVIRKNTIAGKLVPVLCGSALRNKGIQPLLDAVVNYFPSPPDLKPIEGYNRQTGEKVNIPHDPKGNFCALAFKIQMFEDGRRLTLIRIYSGSISDKDEVLNSTRNEKEKLSRIFLMHANERKRIETARAGDIVGVLGLKNTMTGETITSPDYRVVLEKISGYEPVISQAIETLSISEKEKLDASLTRFSHEDPSFHFHDDAETGQTIISGMGELHLEIIAERLRREFGLDVRTGKPQVLYTETITKNASGEGKFERLIEDVLSSVRIEISVSPAQRKEGIITDFEPSFSGISPARAEIIKQGIMEALKGGAVHGLPITDISVTVRNFGISGNFEDETVSINIAIMNAVKDACEKANPQKLFPITKIAVIVPSEYLGEVIGSLQARHGSVTEIVDREQVKVINAAAPLENMFGYSTELRSLTQGRGTFTMQFSHYDVMPS